MKLIILVALLCMAILLFSDKSIISVPNRTLKKIENIKPIPISKITMSPKTVDSINQITLQSITITPHSKGAVLYFDKESRYFHEKDEVFINDLILEKITSNHVLIKQRGVSRKIYLAKKKEELTTKRIIIDTPKSTIKKNRHLKVQEFFSNI